MSVEHRLPCGTQRSLSSNTANPTSNSRHCSHPSFPSLPSGKMASNPVVPECIVHDSKLASSSCNSPNYRQLLELSVKAPGACEEVTAQNGASFRSTMIFDCLRLGDCFVAALRWWRVSSDTFCTYLTIWWSLDWQVQGLGLQALRSRVGSSVRLVSRNL